MSKTYMPSNLLNSNYYYKIQSGGYFQVITNNNCTGSGSSQYCSCYNYLYDLDIISQSYSCQRYISNNTSYFTANNFTSEVWYRKDLAFSLIIFFILFIFIIKYPFRLVSRMFGRWLKL